MRSTWLLGFLGVVAACGGRQVTNESTSGNNPPETSGSGGTASTSAGSGGTVTGAAGTLGAAGDLQPPDLPPTRCSFRSTTMPNMGKPLPGPLVQMRIVRFITGSDGVVPADTPNQVTPQWAADSASKLLDSFGGASSAAPGGFVRWLAQWSLGKAPLSASRWANVMAQPSATLSSLIAAPNPDNAPHGVGYMTDKEILTGRHSIDTRGMMVLDHLLCMQIPPPPPNIMLPAPTPMPGVTDRQAHAAILSNPSCAACHRMIDPFGHAFEHFDAMGATAISTTAYRSIPRMCSRDRTALPCSSRASRIWPRSSPPLAKSHDVSRHR